MRQMFLLGLVLCASCAQMSETLVDHAPGRPDRKIQVSYTGTSSGARSLMQARRLVEIAQSAVDKGLPVALNGNSVQAGWYGLWGGAYGYRAGMTGPYAGFALQSAIANGGVPYALPPLVQPPVAITPQGVQTPQGVMVPSAATQIVPCPRGRSPATPQEQAACAAQASSLALRTINQLHQ